ncbi:MAG: ribonucleotide-diphosphate reductase subunit beta [Akkermansiaceae bacterium]
MNATLDKHTIPVDPTKAEQYLAQKKVIGGKPIPGFGLAPLKYEWAYEIYSNMRANHWEPEDIPMQKDVEQWRSSEVSDVERWIIKMGIGYFSAAEGIVGDNIIHVIRDQVTAPELELVFRRHAHEENIHADSLVYMVSSLGLNPHECEAIFEGVRTVQEKTDFVVSNSRSLRRDMDMSQLENKQALARNAFIFGQCMEGTQFYGLFGMILSLYRQNKFPGIGQMFRYTLRDESNHIELLKNLLNEIVKENPEIWTPEFKEDLRSTMAEAIKLEKNFIRDCLPVSAVGLNIEDFHQYIDYIADRRLTSCGLDPLDGNASNPFPWLAEMIDIKKEQNFFEGRVTEYQKSTALGNIDDDEL